MVNGTNELKNKTIKYWKLWSEDQFQERIWVSTEELKHILIYDMVLQLKRDDVW